ncbi:DUF5700 domain-containing putative Zn-dependent protease [Portibacter lacus]|uniref:Uncharacterized protein n=1 Tax=Portibacter lacus TaxID=1099794 RepID=A0AA37SYF0_9BACT|nr:DUF5700 domain-containing putative Zn-dependent protease [Portibacter lacus]GLR19923.1 hypothetical protein GCM10007940_45390 [Portibacter lacus]
MSKFETQDEVSIEELNELWNAPGYSSWTGSEKSQGIYFNYFSLVNAPHLQDSLNLELEESEGYRLVLFNHFIEAKQKQSELTEFAKKLMASDIIEQAKLHALKYLPDTIPIDLDSTLISLMIFQPDAFAIPEDDIIILDVLFAYNYGDGFEKFLGHELHHIYSSKYLSKLKPIDYEKDALIWSIDKLRNEGIADLIDKQNIVEKEDLTAYDRKYIDHYNNSKQYLRTIDSLLQIISQDEAKLHEVGKEIRRQLPYGAHPTGLFIAKLIKKEMGDNALISCLESPFPFLYLYNEIAMNSNGDFHVFSKSSIDYLKKLEKEFIEKKIESETEPNH